MEGPTAHRILGFVALATGMVGVLTGAALVLNSLPFDLPSHFLERHHRH